MKRVLVVAVAGAALALSACGAKSDEDKIEDLVSSLDDDPAAICEQATDRLLAQLGGKTACEQLAKTNRETGKSEVSNVKVDGDKATATVTDEAGPATFTFRKVDGEWKVDSAA